MQEKLEKEHFLNFCTFEIASLVNVPRHYLTKYGNFPKKDPCVKVSK